jgi:hypothetical protein
MFLQWLGSDFVHFLWHFVPFWDAALRAVLDAALRAVLDALARVKGRKGICRCELIGVKAKGPARTLGLLSFLLTTSSIAGGP